jgi:cellulose synthase/poly-beta-1,6-N-acetylglucosamine synthase-like glycosyltransferase
MMMVAEIVFWILFGILFYSYFVFPFLLRILSKIIRCKREESPKLFKYPAVSVIISVYNEQAHIENKLQNILNSNYPSEKIEIIVGSDGSNDKTNSIISAMAATSPLIKPLYFKDRRGKSSVINDCVSVATGEFLILTDAKALFDEETMTNLLKNFHDPRVGIAGATIINNNSKCKGIAHQESTFMSQEIKVKYDESVAFGCCVGIYGACYAIRKELLPCVPQHFAVDDFYISMKVLEKRHHVILDIKSRCYENVTSKLTEEFRRKVRIGVGNIQNLKTFSHLLLRFNALSFCFLSHKVIRWIGPFLLIAMLFLNAVLWNEGLFYKILLIIQLLGILASVIDFYIKKNHLRIVILRFIIHFYLMNFALLVGFYKYVIGVKANVWEPTNR